MLRLVDIARTYRMGAVDVRALRNVTVSIGEGEFVAVTGPSGSGKSTLLHLLGFLDRSDSGSYTFRGDDVTELSDDDLASLRNRFVGFVFQQFHLLPRVTAIRNVALPLIYAGRSHLRTAAAEKLAAVGLAQRHHHRPSELSGGEQQRVAIARALVNEPLLILADEPTGNLDSKSGLEIMTLLEALNEQGKTIVMVTHEKEIAARAARVLRMHDGEIVADEPTARGAGTRSRKGDGVTGAGQTRGGFRPETRRWQTRVMDHGRQAICSILAHKLRSVLSMLGILVGVAAVVAMVAIAEGARVSIEQSLTALGSNLLVVRPGAPRRHGVLLQTGAVPRFTRDDARRMAELPAIRRAGSSVQGMAQVVHKNKNWNTTLEGRALDYAVMHNWVPTVGRFFTKTEIDRREKVAVLGATVASELFGERDPIGRTIKINRLYFRVIGIFPSRGGTRWYDWDDMVVIPITTAMYRVFGERHVQYIELEVKEAALIEQAKREIEQYVTGRQRLMRGIQEGVVIRDMTEIQNAVTGTTRTMGWLLAFIALISLLVGGIGIMNIMLVSVTERTREIGTRKAVGARGRDVMAQFLIEAVAMTSLGGVMGILLGSSIAALLARLAGWPIRISPYAVALATTFSIAVGMIFGLWPARQAARLDPIAALRYE